MTRLKDGVKTMDLSKRYKLSEEELERLSWLKYQKINTDDGTLCFWAKTYQLSRLIEVFDEAKRRGARSIGAYMTSLFEKEAVLENVSSKSNKEYAKSFKKEFQWNNLEILEKYAKVLTVSGYQEEIPYHIDAQSFQNKLYNLFSSN
jgi:hypothetical protein